MNKCPKCGSEAFEHVYIKSRGYTFWRCAKCFDYEPDYDEIEQIKHQARLDKVLSKFYKVIDGNIFALRFDIKTEVLDNAKTEVYLYTETNGKLILEMVDVYVDEEWLMTTEIEHSLDTVESLLKDLENE